MLDNSFDAVTVGWGLRNVPDISYVIQEMQRVVKPGGIIVSLDMGKPELPIFKQIYWIFCKRMVPFMGKVWTEKKWAYDYLFHSAKAFLPPKELALLFSKTGLVNVTYHNLFGGVVAVVEGHKPDSK